MTLLGVTNAPFVSSMVTAKDGLSLILGSEEEDVFKSPTYQNNHNKQSSIGACTTSWYHNAVLSAIPMSIWLSHFLNNQYVPTKTHYNVIVTPKPLIASLHATIDHKGSIEVRPDATE